MDTPSRHIHLLCCGLTASLLTDEDGEVWIEISQVNRNYETGQESPTAVQLKTSLAEWYTLTSCRERMKVYSSQGRPSEATLSGTTFTYLFHHLLSACGGSPSHSAAPGDLGNRDTLHILCCHWTQLNKHIVDMTHETA